MTFSLHAGAEHDVAEAQDFYIEQAGPVAAERFLEEFERVAKLLVEHPGFGTPTTSAKGSCEGIVQRHWCSIAV